MKYARGNKQVIFLSQWKQGSGNTGNKQDRKKTAIGLHWGVRRMLWKVKKSGILNVSSSSFCNYWNTDNEYRLYLLYDFSN